MFNRTIFVCTVGFFLVKPVIMEPLKTITFNIATKSQNLTCDHSEEQTLIKYTVYEGETFNILASYTKTINKVICHPKYNENIEFEAEYNKKLNTYKFKAEKIMGTQWKCMILAHRDTAVLKPVVHYDNHVFAAAYCYMSIHVRQKIAPQTILVNNMVLPISRTELSDKEVDFTFDYRYADGDIVNVTCANFMDDKMLMLEYNMAGIMSNKSIMRDLLSSKMIGFITKLHSGHDNSYMICTHTEYNDSTKVMVRFVMWTEFNIVHVTINGMTLRPIHTETPNNSYKIEYRYIMNQPIYVKCEVKRPDVIFIEQSKNISDGIKFYLTNATQPLRCYTDYTNGTAAEQVDIHFTTSSFPIQIHPLYMAFKPSNGRVMELYNDYKLNVIFFEFQDQGTPLELTCGPLSLRGQVSYLQFDNDAEKCKREGGYITKPTNLTRDKANTVVTCYLKEENDEPEKDNVLRAIRVVFLERLPTITTITPIIKSTKAPTYTAGGSPASITSHPLEPKEEGYDGLSLMKLAVIACTVLCIIIIFCASIAVIKLRKRNHSQRGPHNRSYENLSEPTVASIPVYPPQWENNYAVPLDRQPEDETYSVPFQQPDLYATPTPKNLRNKKQKQLDPTYAVLEVPNKQGQKNMYKETDDPNYSEVYATRPEACYAEVLTKSVRNKMEQNSQQYSNVTTEPPYANDPEPMYCEPAKAQSAEYANLNKSLYANSNAQEYAEPTYCEPQKG